MIEVDNEDKKCPCTNCPHDDFCTDHKTACRAYSNYLKHGFHGNRWNQQKNFRVPTLFFYNRCHPNDKHEISDDYLRRFGQKICERGLHKFAFTLYGMNKAEIRKAVRLYQGSLKKEVIEVEMKF